MKFKTRIKSVSTIWEDFLVIWPRKTEDHYWVSCETVERKYKFLQDGGRYIYRVKK